MYTKMFLAGLAMAAMLVPASGALTTTGVTPDFPLEYLLPADFTCENGAHETSFPDPTNPTLMVSVHIQCPNPNEVSLDGWGTDCPGMSWSHWQGPIASAWTYTFDTTNPYGFSQSNVASAWNAANSVYEAQVTSNIYNGYTFGGTNADSGVYDSYVLAEFRYLSGQLRTAVGVQWAWTSNGQIIHTDAAYNTRYAFSLNGAANTYDLQSVAAHEMGHGYGLGHADTSTASKCLTLYPYATLGATHGRTLGDGDIESIKRRGYGG